MRYNDLPIWLFSILDIPFGGTASSIIVNPKVVGFGVNYMKYPSNRKSIRVINFSYYKPLPEKNFSTEVFSKPSIPGRLAFPLRLRYNYCILLEGGSVWLREKRLSARA